MGSNFGAMLRLVACLVVTEGRIEVNALLAIARKGRSSNDLIALSLSQVKEVAIVVRR